MPERTAVPVTTKMLVLHEAGYLCANPTCRTVLTIEIHHLNHVADGGSNSPTNLIALCPNCHSLHHAGKIPIASLRAWKMLLLSLNEAFDRRVVDLLLALSILTDQLVVSGDGMLRCAPLLASDLITVEPTYHDLGDSVDARYLIALSPKGRAFVDAWKRGDQDAAVRGTPTGNASAQEARPADADTRAS